MVPLLSDLWNPRWIQVRHSVTREVGYIGILRFPKVCQNWDLRWLIIPDTQAECEDEGIYYQFEDRLPAVRSRCLQGKVNTQVAIAL